jgi:MFS family permease
MTSMEPVVTEPPARWREVFSGRGGRLAVGLLLLEALVAIQVLVVATVMPDVRRDLGGTSLYGLVFTASSLATFAAIPIAGRAVDALGPRTVLPPVLGLFGAGMIVAATAPAMAVLLAGRFVMGAGGGGLYALSVGTVAKTFPDRLRPRVMALMATMWILPGLLAPPLAALLSSTVGWRWAFVAPIPVMLIAWILIAPALGRGRSARPPDAGSPVRWSLQLMVGAGLVFTSLTVARWWALAPIAAGFAIGLPALAKLVPPGTFRARRGPPATALSAFLLSVGFLAVDAFLTLMLTSVRHLSLAEASLAVTGATLTWALGSAWQSGRAQRIPLSRLVIVGTIFAIVGQALVASALRSSVPVAIAFLGWGVLGFGMGVVFPTLPLATMRASGAGEEGGAVSSVLLMDVLGAAVGAGLGGGAVAVSRTLGRPLAEGIAWSFAIGVAALIALLLAGRRIDPAAPGGEG